MIDLHRLLEFHPSGAFYSSSIAFAYFGLTSALVRGVQLGRRFLCIGRDLLNGCAAAQAIGRRLKYNSSGSGRGSRRSIGSGGIGCNRIRLVGARQPDRIRSGSGRDALQNRIA